MQLAEATSQTASAGSEAVGNIYVLLKLVLVITVVKGSKTLKSKNIMIEND